MAIGATRSTPLRVREATRLVARAGDRSTGSLAFFPPRTYLHRFEASSS
jgi:hypothetical protein